MAMLEAEVMDHRYRETDRQVAQFLHREIPNDDYVVIPDAEHMSPLGHPKAVSAAIADHLCQAMPLTI